EGGVAQTESLRRAEERLLEWGFLQEVERAKLLEGSKTYSYKVTIELVRRWLLKRHPFRRAIWDLEQLDPEAQRNYEEAVAVQQQDHIFEALKLYEQVLQANPNHFHALFNMAEACLEVEEFSKAVELYLRAYRVDPIHTKEGFVRALLSYGRDLM